MECSRVIDTRTRSTAVVYRKAKLFEKKFNSQFLCFSFVYNFVDLCIYLHFNRGWTKSERVVVSWVSTGKYPQ